MKYPVIKKKIYSSHIPGSRLLRGVDSLKDQTLFLCQIQQRALQKTMFPVGGYQKIKVKAMALEAGMEWIVKKKEVQWGSIMTGTIFCKMLTIGTP